MREIIENALRKSHAEYTDIRIEDVASSDITFRGKDLEKNRGQSYTFYKLYLVNHLFQPRLSQRLRL